MQLVEEDDTFVVVLIGRSSFALDAATQLNPKQTKLNR